MIGIKQIPSLFRMSAITDGSAGLTAWSVAEQLPLRRKAESEPLAAPDQCTCGLALMGDGVAYNEEAFRYLLAIERKRFEQSNQPFVLVLIDLAQPAGIGGKMAAVVGAKIFASLARTLRDTDIIGWYRDDRIVGAILTYLADAPLGDISQQMAERVTKALGVDLPVDVAQHLKVRLYQPLAGIKL